MPRIDHRHPVITRFFRVLEGGIKMWCRSTLWITVTFERFFNDEFATALFYA